MNVDHFRQSLKSKWLLYYQENRDWIVRMGIWVTSQGQRRPSSSFILATLSILEPKLTQLLPLVVDLSNNPDRIVLALGLNFNPDEELRRRPDLTMQLPAGEGAALSMMSPEQAIAQRDEDCMGVVDPVGERASVSG